MTTTTTRGQPSEAARTITLRPAVHLDEREAAIVARAAADATEAAIVRVLRSREVLAKTAPRKGP